MTDNSFSSAAPLSRRSVLGLLGAVPAAAAFAGATVSATGRAHAATAGQLNIYSWPDYFSADTLAAYANSIFNAAERGFPLTSAEAWVGSLAYTFQLYFDFSGYTDMAIGVALPLRP